MNSKLFYAFNKELMDCSDKLKELKNQKDKMKKESITGSEFDNILNEIKIEETKINCWSTAINLLYLK